MVAVIKRPALLPIVALGMSLWASDANAQCVTLAFAEHQNDPEVALIFHGTAKRIDRATQRTQRPDGKVLFETDQIVTFEVHRLWKGAGSRNVTVYNVSSGSEGHAVIVGRQYLVFAYVMSPEGRESYRLPKNGPDVLIASCDLQESSNPYADGLTGDDAGIVSH